MKHDQTIPVGDNFLTACTDALHNVGHLMTQLVDRLPENKKDALTALMSGGGRVGVELSIDRAGMPLIVLVGIELEGARRQLMTVETGGRLQ